MQEPKYKTPNGQIVDKKELQSKYGAKFDELVKNYCLSFALKRFSTLVFSTLFELTYHLVIKKSTKQKAMMDELRQRNGNLTITLTVQRFNQVD